MEIYKFFSLKFLDFLKLHFINLNTELILKELIVLAYDLNCLVAFIVLVSFIGVKIHFGSKSALLLGTLTFLKKKLQDKYALY